MENCIRTRLVYTEETLKSIDETNKQLELDLLKRIRESKKNVYEHQFLNEIYSIIGQQDFYDKDNCYSGVEDDIIVYNNDRVTVNMKIGRANKSVFTYIIDIDYAEDYFGKSECFETTKKVVTLTRRKQLKERVKCSYGNLIDMKRSLTPQLTKLIKETKMFNTLVDTNESKDIWDI